MMNKIGKLDFVPVSIVILASVVRLFNVQLNSFILAVVFPIIMIFCLVKNKNVLKSICFRKYILLLLWILITTFFSIDLYASINTLKPIMGGLIISIIMYALAIRSRRNGYWLMISYILSFFSTVYYLWINGELLNLDISKTRLDLESVNANDLAYYLFYIAIVVSLFNWNGKGRIGIKGWIAYVSLIGMILFVSIITASRQVLIMVLPFTMISFLYRSMSTFKINKILIILSFIGIFILLGYKYYINNYYEGSYLELRMEEDVKEDSRIFLLKKAVEIGIRNPIVGVGSGNVGKFTGGPFSHCSYTELFATTGVIGLILFFSIVFGVISTNYRRYKETGNRVFAYLFLAVIGWAIYNIFYAFYTSPWLISFLFLLVGYSDCYYRQLKYD